MANITLRRQIFGDGYSGTIDVPAGLSWMDSQAIQSTARSAWQTTEETRRARQALDSIAYDAGAAADAIGHLENSIGLHLDTQTRVLERQSEVLEEIRGAVMNPSKTRAAERIADASQLLDHDRFERAVKVAEEATDADPNNPNGFFAAGWALVGLERFEDARAMFEEARDASHGDQRSLGCRQAARSAFLAGKPDLAYQLSRDARGTAESVDEAAAVNYDVAVYASATDDPDTAIASIEEACRADSRHGERALRDPAFDQAPDVRDAAARVLGQTAEVIAEQRPRVEGKIRNLREGLPRPPANDSRSHTQLAVGIRPERDWNQLRASIKQRLVELDRAIATAEEDARLQHMVSALASADEQLVELEMQDLPLLEEATKQHDESVRRQLQLEGDRQVAERNRGRWVAFARLRGQAAKRRGWLVIGIVLTVVGAALTGVVLGFGLLILFILGAMYGVGMYAERELQTYGGRVAQIDRDLEAAE